MSITPRDLRLARSNLVKVETKTATVSLSIDRRIECLPQIGMLAKACQVSAPNTASKNIPVMIVDKATLHTDFPPEVPANDGKKKRQPRGSQVLRAYFDSQFFDASPFYKVAEIADEVMVEDVALNRISVPRSEKSIIAVADRHKLPMKSSKRTAVLGFLKKTFKRVTSIIQ